MDTTQIIILAAGKGTRMGGDIPKALTQLGNQSMLEHVIDTAESLSMKYQPICVVGYKEELIKEVLGDRVLYVTQKDQKGTGHAVSYAMPLLDPSIEQILVLYADQPFVSAETITCLINQKQNSENSLAIATAMIENEELFQEQFYNFGRIIRDDQGHIKAIVERKDATDEQATIHEVNPAYFCCDIPWTIECLRTLKNDNSQEEYYLTDLVKIAFEESHYIDSVQINEREALGANTPEQLAVLESYL
ncbi:MAG: bifunctional UDP-N-acetylglucosamine pyrophosphorylase/glucosamine-1-phosphate N-acetyltransferase [Candidatus Paceibacteria bacterium]|jgi:bifunctional UDP-N-acetylglucosamine pyrophosphorylase/glucosamine-1-phosphate N-acetyltransferase